MEQAIHSILRSLIVIAFLGFSLGACSLLGSDEEDVELFEVRVETIVAPERARVGERIKIELQGSADCGELHHIERAQEDSVITFVAWGVKRDPKMGCPYAPISFNEKETVRFVRAGEYRITAGNASHMIEVR